MDIFKIDIPGIDDWPLNWPGTLIEGLKSKLWVERYRDAGEFTLIGPVGPVGISRIDLRNQLPLGSFVTHIDTQKVMIVENHQISENKETSSHEVTITGRSLETFFENRIPLDGVGSVGSEGTDQAFWWSVQNEDLAFISWAQNPIRQALEMFYFFKYHDQVVMISQAPDSGVSIEREWKFGTLYDNLKSLLEIDNIGWKIVRPGKDAISGSIYDGILHTISNVPDGKIAIVLYKGNDVSSQVQFSYSDGDLSTCDYLWSIKTKKNGAILNASWCTGVLFPNEVNFNRRIGFYQDNGIGSKYKNEPSSGDHTALKAKLDRKMNEIINTKIETSLANVSLSKDITRYKYREDYDLGDIVYIHGDFGINQKMRIVEYAEFEDETGKGGYPTLSGLGDSNA